MIFRNGETIRLNTRSPLALRRAGVPLAQLTTRHVMGNDLLEELLTERLEKNELRGGSPVLRITGAAADASSQR